MAHLIGSNVQVDLPDGPHTRQNGHDAVEDNDGQVGGPSPPSVRLPHAKPHHDRQDEVHGNEACIVSSGWS